MAMTFAVQTSGSLRNAGFRQRRGTLRPPVQIVEGFVIGGNAGFADNPVAEQQ
jgi:hypothetical protein